MADVSLINPDAAFLQNAWRTSVKPRTTPWVSESAIARVLKERRIPPNGGRVIDQSRCGVPSERTADIRQTQGVALGWYAAPRWGGSKPKALPRAGMPRPVGAAAPDSR